MPICHRCRQKLNFRSSPVTNLIAYHFALPSCSHARLQAAQQRARQTSIGRISGHARTHNTTRMLTTTTSFIFHIVYQVFYYFLYLVLIAFLLVTPADLINQSRLRAQNWNIIVITLCYVVTIIIIFFIYVTRLFINRSVLASIPKSYIPIEKGDVSKYVRIMIGEELSRSAAIAYVARPRLAPVATPALDEPDAEQQLLGDAQEQVEKAKAAAREGKHRLTFSLLNKKAGPVDEIAIQTPPNPPVWGAIEHAGWASPTLPDLPNLQYSTVITELPHLIEAKALTLAPRSRDGETTPDMAGSGSGSGSRTMLDAEAVGMLQRAENMGLREYLSHLSGLGVLTPLPVVNDFVVEYEHARYSPRPVSEERFRRLMHLFAEILRIMHPLNPAVLEPGQRDGDSFDDDLATDSDVDDNAPMGTNPSTPGSDVGSRAAPRRSRSGGVARRLSSSTASSHPRRPQMLGRNSSANTWQYRTAPTTPKSRHTALSRSSSANTFAQSRNPYPLGGGSSNGSLRSGGSDGSVIRLATGEDDTDLPYVLNHPVTM
jgi:hypothetical protein